MRLETLLFLRDKIEELKELQNVLTEDYLTELDNDLWTIDLPYKPELTEEYDIKIVTQTPLTKKYLIRFCEDYGLSLKYFEDKGKKINQCVYIFEKEKDILSSLKKYNI